MFIMLDKSFQMRSKRNIFYGLYDSNSELMAEKIMNENPFFGEEVRSSTVHTIKANYWCANDIISKENLRKEAYYTEATKDCGEYGISPIRIDDGHICFELDCSAKSKLPAPQK